MRNAISPGTFENPVGGHAAEQRRLAAGRFFRHGRMAFHLQLRPPDRVIACAPWTVHGMFAGKNQSLCPTGQSVRSGNKDPWRRSWRMSTAMIQESGVASVLRESPIPALRKLSIEESEAIVLINGKVPSYYLKQMAQEAIMPLLDGRSLVNRVLVVSH